MWLHLRHWRWSNFVTAHVFLGLDLRHPYGEIFTAITQASLFLLFT